MQSIPTVRMTHPDGRTLQCNAGDESIWRSRGFRTAQDIAAAALEVEKKAKAKTTGDPPKV